MQALNGNVSLKKHTHKNKQMVQQYRTDAKSQSNFVECWLLYGQTVDIWRIGQNLVNRLLVNKTAACPYTNQKADSEPRPRR